MLSADKQKPSPDYSVELNDEMKKYGITRSSVDYFHLGNYHYSNLKDAIKQAKYHENKRTEEKK
ncbi:MAG: hypothetical protein HQL69_16080 [Magnetococcales bacterium]|nr:hypothetical protein [Magnetococcales bacterium]